MTDLVEAPTRPRRTRRALYGAIGVGVLVAALIGVLATRSVAPQVTASSTLLDHSAPQISGRSIATGAPVSLSGLKGRYAVVVFFASWCSPCIDEVPELESFLFAHQKANDVSVLGVDIDDSSADAASFLRRTGATWPAIEDGNGLISQRYGVSDPPQSFLVNPKGIIVDRVLSGVTAAELDQLITQQSHSGTENEQSDS